MFKQFFILFLLFFSNVAAESQSPPKPEREFRAVWIATVSNIDFPTKKRFQLSRVLGENVYAKDALIPETNWIKTAKPLAPNVKITRDEKLVRAVWTERCARKAFWFVVSVKDKNGWSYSILPATEKTISLSADRKIEKMFVTSVDRLGNESSSIEIKIK
jgi:hypothetical protein